MARAIPLRSLKAPAETLPTPRYIVSTMTYEDGPYEMRLTFEDGHTMSTYASGPLAYRCLSIGVENWIDNDCDADGPHGPVAKLQLFCAGVEVEPF
ncbi:hypothetical protein EOE18_15390 [Novosphingobium umbonatum]|uniref:Uncharacterized protein n=1 Tax=Novosphingobium umbonatum TaxID=1908524 RepID=A0A437N0T3_9SPHN|nr:hypothetical protein [Novosphingobium umbonatum]RVU03504.1 hypothetical protein EOE18_15390 [Novosphingobium umbonatum]